MKIRDKNFGLIGTFVASILGILSPLCMYGTIPIAASFSNLERLWFKFYFSNFLFTYSKNFSAGLENT